MINKDVAEAMTPATCQKMSGELHYEHYCGLPVVADGLCKSHYAAAERQKVRLLEKPAQDKRDEVRKASLAESVEEVRAAMNAQQERALELAAEIVELRKENEALRRDLAMVSELRRIAEVQVAVRDDIIRRHAGEEHAASDEICSECHSFPCNCSVTS